MRTGFLYKITNINNNKSYIGKTYDSVASRLKDHFSSSKRFPERPLYRAINKYSKESFTIETLGEYIEGELEAKEIEAIAKYDTYNNGYNATLGGDGKKYLKVSDLEIIENFLRTNNLAETARNLNISKDSVRLVINNNNLNKKKDISQAISITIVEIDESFDSISSCAKFLYDNEISCSLGAGYSGIQRAIKSGNTYKNLTFRSSAGTQ